MVLVAQIKDMKIMTDYELDGTVDEWLHAFIIYF